MLDHWVKREESLLSCRAVYRPGMLSIRQAATTLYARSSREKEELSPLLPERCAFREPSHWCIYTNGIQLASCQPRWAWLLTNRTVEWAISCQSTTLMVAGSRKMRKEEVRGVPMAAHSSPLIGPTWE